MYILGVSAYYHDSGVALIKNETTIARIPILIRGLVWINSLIITW